MGFMTAENGPLGWFVSPAEKINGEYYYLWKNDLELHRGSTGANLYENNAPGYYETKAEAERYLRAYEVKQMVFVIRQSVYNRDRGWYVILNKGLPDAQFLWKDLELHTSTGYSGTQHYGQCGAAPGYYVNELSAAITLQNFKEKHIMADNIGINVTVNGVTKPLHEISVETLLSIREDSKPKPVPVFQVANLDFCGDPSPRLIFKMTPQIAATKVGNYVLLDESGNKVAAYKNMCGLDKDYCNRHELKLEEL